MVSFINDKLMQLMAWWDTLKNSEKGQGLVEYALIIALIAIALVVSLTAMQGGIGGVFNRITEELGNLPGS